MILSLADCAGVDDDLDGLRPLVPDKWLPITPCNLIDSMVVSDTNDCIVLELAICHERLIFKL